MKGGDPRVVEFAYPDYAYALRHGLDLLGAIDGHTSESVEQALLAFKHALCSLPSTAPRGLRASALANIAIAYQRRTEGDPVANAEEAVKALRCALRDVPKDDREALKPRLIAALGAAYLRTPGKSASYIERALRCLHAALSHLPTTVPAGYLGSVQANLGFAYTQRISGEHADNIENAIWYASSAVKSLDSSDDRMYWSDAQATLGAAYLERTRDGYSANIERAIFHLGASCAATPKRQDPYRWASTKALLGKAFVMRVDGEKEQNLRDAVSNFADAVDVLRDAGEPVTWAAARFDLASAEDDLAVQANDRAARRDVEAGYREAQRVFDENRFPLEWAKIENAVGILYGRSPQTFEAAERAFRGALAKLEGSDASRERQRTLRNLGGLLFEAGRWKEALDAYDEAIALGEEIGATAYTDAGRREEATIASQIYADSAYALLRLKRCEEALARLEQGKARLLAQALALAEVDEQTLRKKVPLNLASAFVRARDEIRALDHEATLPPLAPGRRTDTELGQCLRKARGVLSSAAEALESHGVEVRARGLTIADIVALARERSLVFPLVSSAGGACFIVPAGASSPSDVEQFALKALSTETVAELTRNWRNAYRRDRARSDAMAVWQKEIVSVLAQLWALAMGPIAGKLRELGIPPDREVVVMPEGGLGLLPLPAAGSDDRYFLDDWTVSLAPSAHGLAASLRSSREARRKAPSLLAVIDPTNDLEFARLEGERVCSRFTLVHALCGAEATQEAVLAAAKRATYLHFACHAFYGFANVLDSALVLADGDRLELQEVVMSASLPGTRLAALSACESGITETEDAPDECVGLASAFLQAGAASVLGTLWAVDDLSTALLIDRFYDRHLRGGMTPPAALRDAQRWLRRATAEDLQLAALLESSSRADEPDVAERIRLYRAHPALRAFQSPHHWAAFTVTGS